MKKYVYKNATVYITIPTEKQLENIRKATERFAKNVIKEKIKNGNKYSSKTIDKK